MLIGLSGYARTGKDTVAAILVERHDFTRVAFADALKRIAEEIDPYIAANARLSHDLHWYDDVIDACGSDGWEHAKRRPETRRFLQKLGEACRTIIDEDIWLDTAMRKASTVPGSRVVISDVRYPNEAQRIVDVGGEVWRIERPGTGPANAHISETALDYWPFDRYIRNDGSLDQLGAAVAVRLAELHYTGNADFVVDSNGVTEWTYGEPRRAS